MASTPPSPSRSQASALQFAPWTCGCKWRIANRKKSQGSTILAVPFSTFSTPSNTRSNCMRSPRKSHQSVEVLLLHTWGRHQGLLCELCFAVEEQVKCVFLRGNQARRNPKYSRNRPRCFPLAFRSWRGLRQCIPCEAPQNF